MNNFKKCFPHLAVDLTTHEQKISGTAVNGISDEKSDGSTNSKKASEESTSNIIKNSNSQSRLARSHQTEHTSSLQSLSVSNNHSNTIILARKNSK